MTMVEMRASLKTILEGLLQAHDSDYIVDITERKELEQNMDRLSRVSIMGDPAKYCAIFDLGQVSILGSSFDAAGNTDCFIGQRFRVQLFYEKDYNGSQTTFETIVYADRDAATPGILDSIRETRNRTVSGESYMIGLPGNDAFALINRGTWDFGALGGQPELYHYLELELILIS